jgi:selenide, water dikinase
VLTGVRKGILDGGALEAAAAWMTELNAAAADSLRPFEPAAVTDVTGFGLFGHACEVAARSDVRLVLEADRLPALEGALEAAEQGLATGGDLRNREFAAPSLDHDGVPDAVKALGFDPQTAGGLLASVAASKAAVLEARFRAEGLFLARIGSVEEGAGVAVS